MLLRHSPSSLKNHAEWEKCLMTGEMLMLFPSSKGKEGPGKLASSKPYLHPKEYRLRGQYNAHRIGCGLHLPLFDKAVHGWGKKTLLPFSQGINNRRDG